MGAGISAKRERKGDRERKEGMRKERKEGRNLNPVVGEKRIKAQESTPKTMVMNEDVLPRCSW